MERERELEREREMERIFKANCLVAQECPPLRAGPVRGGKGKERESGEMWKKVVMKKKMKG